MTVVGGGAFGGLVASGGCVALLGCQPNQNRRQTTGNLAMLLAVSPNPVGKVVKDLERG